MSYSTAHTTTPGLSYFLAAFVVSGIVLSAVACSSERAPEQSTTIETDNIDELYDGNWQVEDIDNGGIIDRSHITLRLSREGKISGSTGCNQYFGSTKIGQSAFQVDNTGSTRKACVPALMQQEQRFLQALNSVRRYKTDETFLSLYDEADTQRMRLIRTSKETTTEPAPAPQGRIDPDKH